MVEPSAGVQFLHVNVKNSPAYRNKKRKIKKILLYENISDEPEHKQIRMLQVILFEIAALLSQSLTVDCSSDYA